MKNKLLKIKKILIALVVIALLIAAIKVFSIEVTYTQGVNGIKSTRTIPLYLKIQSFLNRHFHYKYLASELTKNTESREEKIRILLKWARENIKPQPQELAVIDDHPLHIIVRGYGTDEQVEDVFTLLCNYAGIPAYMSTLKTKDPLRRATFSFVYFEKKWRIIHAAHEKIFLVNNSWATLKDVTEHPEEVLDIDHNLSKHRELTYRDFFSHYDGSFRVYKSRYRKQTPHGRIFQEIIELF